MSGQEHGAPETGAEPGDAEPQSAEELPPEVREAIAENPGEVARFLGNLDEVNDLLDGTAVATSAMDDGMVKRLTERGSNLGAAADGLATPEAATLGEAAGENAGEIADAVETLGRLQRTGTLDDVVELLDTLALVSAAMDDEMVRNLAATGSRLGEVADTAADDDVARSLERLLEALGEADAQPAESPGVIGLLRATREPEVKAGMGYLIAIARALGDGAEDR
jgi:uncharacterized protein YjgD (DUF1641 family)